MLPLPTGRVAGCGSEWSVAEAPAVPEAPRRNDPRPSPIRAQGRGRIQTIRRIVKRIASLTMDGDKGAFQPPPASPVENRYFSAAPYLFGRDRAMKSC